MKPTVGRIVHYWTHDKKQTQPLAAVITYVHNDDCVNLWVFPHHVATEGLVFTSVIRAVEPKADCWNWPPRE